THVFQQPAQIQDALARDHSLRQLGHQNLEAFQHYQNNKGIIKAREVFLEQLASNQGKNIAEDAKAEDESLPSFDRTIIVPVAVPGSGKTAVPVALAHIFGFDTRAICSHVQKPGRFSLKTLLNLLQSHDVVIADKCVCIHSVGETSAWHVYDRATTSDNTVLRSARNLTNFTRREDGGSKKKERRPERTEKKRVEPLCKYGSLPS
ncbi:hypothetical protein APHAL10511_001468, partial [Amanita phalloides]